MIRVPKSKLNRLLSIVFLLGISLTAAEIAFAVQANPGHGINTLGGVVAGDLLYGSNTDVVSALADIATGNALISGGVTPGLPSWGKVGLTTHVSGILPTANGGTGMAFFTAAGPTIARIFTFPDAAATVLTSNAAVTVAQGGTGLGSLTANSVIIGNGTSNPVFVAPGTAGNLLQSNGTNWTSSAPINNYSTAAQTLTAATLTYITGSKITVPVGKLRIGTMFRWTFDITKTTAGIAASTYNIVVGTLGTTGDTVRVSFTKPAGTAVVDNGRITIDAIVRGPLSASGIMVGQFNMTHNLASTGHATVPAVNVTTVSGAFDVTVANLFVGITATTGASDAITIQMVKAEVVNL